MCYSEVGRLSVAKTLEVILLHAFNKKTSSKYNFVYWRYGEQVYVNEVEISFASYKLLLLLTLFQRGFVTYPLQRYIHLGKDNSEHNAPL